MPEFLADPSVLTKEKLKSELIANNVSLPGGEQRKDVYVQLYLQHLTARNAPAALAQPDFSSDEEREPTPLGARSRGGAAPGRKATKKTDKPRLEEKDDLDVTELSNEDLQEQLVKYGVTPGPILATTRQIYEKKLQKLKEQGPELGSSTPLPTVSSSAENTRQNGNNDSDQYSDNEEDPKVEFRLQKREPLKAKTKTPVTLKQRRVVEHNQNYSQDGVTEAIWTSGSSKSGPLQAVSRESTRVSRRTPRKRVETTAQLPVDDAVMSEGTPIAETIVASSNETLQVVNRVPGNFKHAAPTLSISEFSDLPRRTPKKPLMTAEVVEKTLAEERRVERDILKEMFPYEVSTPTGISASCRRPIKGAAGRPIELSDFRMEESFSSKYVSKYVPSADDKPEKPITKKRSIPMWIKILLFVVVSVFLFVVYQSMETNQGNPFSKYLGVSEAKTPTD
ncbi:Lamina-associated polypeptide 2, isoforms beta/delta/epsilon/gamma [Platysternon megacephalum]|uniref:Lamina-associated polypeptide 2, isoforms beta/delta/epsilon/gamma n=1 Tax=Platysternon megacephalum TaxID=55544 RepID=A0A4D9E8Y2_9SAUR|nr:Lamina-associated polypeptide 2, isoforms beta/delta/epsilon/gamma [Platysternon megacephalum]